jgi:hypothetical protein
MRFSTHHAGELSENPFICTAGVQALEPDA